MWKVYKYPKRKDWKKILERPGSGDKAIAKKVEKILENVKNKGDKALRKYSRELDRAELETFLVPAEEVANAATFIDEELKTAISVAAENIRKFHSSQLRKEDGVEISRGIVCWRKNSPIDRAGIYIPGGSAPLFSTVLMLAIPARLAGVKEIVLCSPPVFNQSIHPSILYCASICGITEIYKIGGAHAIAAMGYGTNTIRSVNKIFGPGNSFVTTAKQLLQKEGIAIDMPAGPSEVLVIADDSANAEFVAADLLSQAEHDSMSQVVFVTDSETLLKNVSDSLKEQLKKLARKKIAGQAMRNSKAILARDIETAVEISNAYAPEHLLIQCNDANQIAENITSAGSVFIGNYSPEAAGDYATGTNHTLPTSGFAASYSGVSTDSFVKKITFQQLSEEGFEEISGTVIRMAEAEGLDAHSNAIKIRIDELKKKKNEF